MIPAAEFMERWHQMEQIRTQLEHIVRGARDTITEFFKLREHNMTWHPFEMTYDQGKDAVLFEGQYYYGGGGGPDSESWIIPLDAVLAGKSTVFSFFVEEKRKEEEKARELGRLREQREVDKRRADFLKLKAEFDPDPISEAAIVKSSV